MGHDRLLSVDVTGASIARGDHASEGAPIHVADQPYDPLREPGRSTGGMKAHDASTLLGAKQLAGVEVSSKGRARKLTTVVTRRASAAGDAVDDGARQLPALGRAGYLAVSKREVVVVKMRSGVLTMRLSDTVLSRAPRMQIASLEWQGGTLLSQLSLAFSNGVVWRFDVTNASRSSAEAVVRALGRKDLL
jgi:hypothetical protein